MVASAVELSGPNPSYLTKAGKESWLSETTCNIRRNFGLSNSPNLEAIRSHSTNSNQHRPRSAACSRSTVLGKQCGE